MHPLEIHLLGNFSLQDGKGSSPTFSDRQQSLLGYLLLNAAQPQPRQQIAFLFWPDSSDQQAKTNLRQLLHHLRQSWPDLDYYLDISSRHLRWKFDAPLTLDTHQFQNRIEHAEQSASAAEACQLLEEAIECYQGDLLPACYDDWVEPLRQQLQQQYMAAHERLIHLHEMQGNHQAAIHWADLLRQRDPLHEECYRVLMRLHALTDNRATALRIYHLCETILREELGVDPSPATREQYERLLTLTAPPSTSASAASNQIPLLGRAQEWRELQRIWQRSLTGQSQMMLIHGEAGIGKTRLLEEFAQWAMLQNAVTAQTCSYAAQAQLTYAPVTDWLRSEPLRSTLATLDKIWLGEIARLLPELQVDYPDLPPPVPMTESWQRERFYEALARAVIHGADGRPLLLVVDDLQWSGEGVLEWLGYLLHFAAKLPILVIGTIRSGTIDVGHPLQTWVTVLRQEQLLTELRLHPLSVDDAAQLAQHVAGRALKAEQSASLYRETEGNPFFIVEMAQAVLEQSDPPPRKDAIIHEATMISLPPKVRAVIESRLNQLSTAAQELADYAAVIGREFSFAVLAQSREWDEESLVLSLDELWQRRIVREQGTTAYDFSHDKIREVVYNRISRARRRLLHRRVAEALLTLHGDTPAAISAQLAHHYEQAQMTVQAISCYQQAAEEAQRVYANADVIRLLTKALDLLHSLPPSAELDAQELSLRVARCAPLVALTGYNSPEVMAEYQRVLALCQRLALPPDPRALRGLAIAHILQADFQKSWTLGQQIIALERTRPNAVLRVEGHYVLGVSAFWRGQFAEARRQLEQALSHYTPTQSETHIRTYAQDPGIICATRLAWTLWHLGYPDQAFAMMDSITAPGPETRHPFSQAYALAFACMLYEDAEDQQRLQEQAAQLDKLAGESNFFYLRNWAAFHQGWITGIQGDYPASVRQIRQVIERWHSEKTYLLTPRMLERLAVAYWRSHRLAQGSAILAEAWSAAVQRNETYFLAEITRMKGEFQWAQGGAAAAVAACFQEAVDLARRQGARMLELRALVSLCRLWQIVGEAAPLAAAQRALQARYDWFTEGFASADLRAARTLLAELSPHPPR